MCVIKLAKKQYVKASLVPTLFSTFVVSFLLFQAEYRQQKKDSPYRNRSVEENLRLFEEVRVCLCVCVCFSVF